MEITPDQIRAARALLHLDQAELADRAHVSLVTVRLLEEDDGRQQVAPATVEGVLHVLEQAGAEFIPGGVRRRPAPPPDRRAMLMDLRAISLRSAARLEGTVMLTDADLYDENGLPG